MQVAFSSNWQSEELATVLCPHPPPDSSPEAGTACMLCDHRGVSMGRTWHPSRLFGHSARLHILSWGRPWVIFFTPGALDQHCQEMDQ